MGVWRGMADRMRDSIQTKLIAWAAEQEDLRERKGDLIPEPVGFGLTPMGALVTGRAGPKPKKVRDSRYDEYGGNPPDHKRWAK